MNDSCPCTIQKLSVIRLPKYCNCYVIDIKIKALRAFNFVVDEIKCLHGRNITNNCNFKDLDIIKDKKLKKNEVYEGTIVIEKNYIGTFKPVLAYHGIVKRATRQVKSNVIK